jgi:hypothetical protein
MMLRLQKFDLDVHYQKGTEMHLADALSRAFLDDSTNERNKQEEVILVTTQSDIAQEIEHIDAVHGIAIKAETLKRFQEETAGDHELQALMKVVKNGWPDSTKELMPCLGRYFTYRDEIVVQSGLLLKGDRVIVPSNLRRDCLEKIHSSHLGVDGCTRRARDCIFWPGMTTELEQLIATCGVCRQLESTPPNEPLQSHEIPHRPWAKVG